MPKIVFFSAEPYDRQFFEKSNKAYGFELEFYPNRFDRSVLGVLEDAYAVCVFVNDPVDARLMKALAERGVQVLALRCAGYNHIDLKAARQHGIRVCRVPAYSPQSVAEHALALILSLNRKIHKAYNRVREQNFSLNGLLGFNLGTKTIGVVGTGHIGETFARLMTHFGSRVLAHDIRQSEALLSRGVQYVSLKELLKQADIVSLHCPLNDQTHHLINAKSIAGMKPGAMLINTSRGGLIDTAAVIEGLKTRQIGSLGIDVYEQEENLFFQDLSADLLLDDTLQLLLGFPNVLVTAHQAFFTEEALTQIADTTLSSIQALSKGKTPETPQALVAEDS